MEPLLNPLLCALTVKLARRRQAKNYAGVLPVLTEFEAMEAM
jgi:hypothetical protein